MVTFGKITILSVLLQGGLCLNIDNLKIRDLPPETREQLLSILNGTAQQTRRDCAEPNINQIEFWLYTRNNTNQSVTLNPENATQVDPNKKVILIIHGWISGANTAGVMSLKDAYLKRYDCNLIAIHWTELAMQMYTISACQLPRIAKHVGHFLCVLSGQRNISLHTVHIVGHSLGAHMAGFISQFTKTTCGQQIGRITGLDPAGPLYQDSSKSLRLDRSDAIFVDVIHTNEMILGYTGNCGDVDFHVNCGMFQTGCAATDTFNIRDIKDSLMSVLNCDHSRSIALMAESVNSYELKAKSCQFCPTICITDIVNTDYIVMGENCPRHPKKRRYWIPTFDATPFGKGLDLYASDRFTSSNSKLS